MTSRYHIRQSGVPKYSPANHEGTHNQRLIGRDNVGADRLEVVLGTIQRAGGALPHAHPGIEQVCYLLEGTAQVQVESDAFEMAAGDTCFFPANAQHVFQVTSPVARVLVVYSPPYEENPQRVVRPDPV
jgi:quercetin dioxygenase-like cupin family protein